MKKLIVAAVGMAFLPLVGVWVVSKISEVLESVEPDPWDQQTWTAAEWALWWGDED